MRNPFETMPIKACCYSLLFCCLGMGVGVGFAYLSSLVAPEKDKKEVFASVVFLAAFACGGLGCCYGFMRGDESDNREEMLPLLSSHLQASSHVVKVQPNSTRPLTNIKLAREDSLSSQEHRSSQSEEESSSNAFV